MSKGANSGLLSGGAHRTVQAGGSNSDGNAENHEHGYQLDADGATEKELPFHIGEAVCPSVSTATLWVFERVDQARGKQVKGDASRVSPEFLARATVPDWVNLTDLAEFQCEKC